MTKQDLQQELLNKIKPGVKPSDLKKQQAKNNQLLTPPPTPPLKPSKTKQSPPSIVQTPPDSPILKPTKPSKPANNVKDLQEQVKYWSHTAQNYLLNLSKTSADLFNAEEKIKELEKKATNSHKSPSKNLTKSTIKEQPETVNEVAEKALIEANQRIRELEKQNQLLKEKPTKSLTKSQSTQTPHEHKEPKHYLFTCDICEQNKKSQLHLSRVNGLGIDPNKQNKICDTCIRKVDLIQERKEEFF